jgi:hypothetical protein
MKSPQLNFASKTFAVSRIMSRIPFVTASDGPGSTGMEQKSAARMSKCLFAHARGAFLIYSYAKYLNEERRRGTAGKANCADV